MVQYLWLTLYYHFLGKPADFAVGFLSGTPTTDLSLLWCRRESKKVGKAKVAFVCTFYRIIWCWATQLTKLTVLMTKRPKGGEPWTSSTQTDFSWHVKRDSIPRYSSKGSPLLPVRQRITWLLDKENRCNNSTMSDQSINMSVVDGILSWLLNFSIFQFCSMSKGMSWMIIILFVAFWRAWHDENRVRKRNAKNIQCWKTHERSEFGKHGSLRSRLFFTLYYMRDTTQCILQ